MMSRPHHESGMQGSGTLYKLGVTGSMGCGKTYVCSQLESLAREELIPLTVFNVDVFRAEVLGRGDNPTYLQVQESLVREFGPGIRGQEGGIDRRALADITYTDPKKLSIAEAIVNGVMEDGIRQKAQQFAQQREKGEAGIFLVESALLVEKKELNLVDYNVVIVHCAHDIRMQRLSHSDLPLEQIQQRIALQYSNEQKEAQARAALHAAGRGDLYVFDNSRGSDNTDDGNDAPTVNNLHTVNNFHNIKRLFDEIVEKSRVNGGKWHE